MVELEVYKAKIDDNTCKIDKRGFIYINSPANYWLATGIEDIWKTKRETN